MLAQDTAPVEEHGGEGAVVSKVTQVGVLLSDTVLVVPPCMLYQKHELLKVPEVKAKKIRLKKK